MATPLRNKTRLWMSRRRGIKSSFVGDTKEPAMQREDIPDVLVSNKMKRGDFLQKARLKYYPTVDVDFNELYAGEMRGSFEDARQKLLQLGYRNNPTSYVEVTDEHGPDDGSYAKQFITEDGSKIDIPQVTNQPAFWKRLKMQYHVVLYELQERVLFLCHKEVSAWLQPARHVVRGDVSARIGVRDFREMWYDEFGESLDGADSVKWRVPV